MMETRKDMGVWRSASESGFTLVELVLVVVIIAVAASFLVPILGGVESRSVSEVTVYEMGRVRQAFAKLDSDCLLSDSQLSDIAEYGLWPLFRKEHPADSAKNLLEFDPDGNRGWRGPYAREEGEVEIDSGSDGQSAPSPSGSGVVVPVLRDPYSGYYRVLIPRGGEPARLVLVCCGPDGVLDTTPDDKDSNGDIEARGDDDVVRLLPTR